MSPLERRYRRLLAAYPSAHRAEYGEEMLGVLLDNARPGQRRPGPVESADLLAGALAARVRGWRGLPAAGAWRDAAAVFALMWSVLIAGATLRWIPELWRGGAEWLGWAGLAWTAAVVLQLAGLRRIAAAAAIVGVGLPVVGGGYVGLLPVSMLVPPALLVPAGRGRALALIGRFRFAAMVVLALADAVLSSTLHELPEWLYTASQLLALSVFWPIGEAVARLPAPVRRRTLVLLAPAAAMIGAYFVTDRAYAHVLAPIVVLAAGLLVLRLRERRSYGTRATSA